METEEKVVNLSKNYGVIELLTAAIMRNNDLSYNKANEIAESLNSSDYIFDRLLEDYLDEDDEEWEEEEMTTKEMIRCKDCSYLVEDENGNWVCDDCGKEIHQIPDDECSAEQEW